MLLNTVDPPTAQTTSMRQMLENRTPKIKKNKYCVYPFVALSLYKCDTWRGKTHQS